MGRCCKGKKAVKKIQTEIKEMSVHVCICQYINFISRLVLSFTESIINTPRE